MDAAALQHLLVTLLEIGRAIAGDTTDPMHEFLRDAGNIEAAGPSVDATVSVTTTDGRRLTITIADAT